METATEIETITTYIAEMLNRQGAELIATMHEVTEWNVRNGVLHIQTKSGCEGKIRVTLER